MSTKLSPSHPWDEPLSEEEFAKRLAAIKEQLRPSDVEDVAELSRWFLRRYPTLVERCRYSSRKYREWTNAPKIPPEKIR